MWKSTQPNLNFLWAIFKCAQFLCSGVKRAFVFPGGVYKVDVYEMLQRAGLLKNCIKDDQKQLVALNVLQELVIHMEHPDSECLLVIHLLSRSFVDLTFNTPTFKKPTLH